MLYRIAPKSRPTAVSTVEKATFDTLMATRRYLDLGTEDIPESIPHPYPIPPPREMGGNGRVSDEKKSGRKAKTEAAEMPSKKSST